MAHTRKIPTSRSPSRTTDTEFERIPNDLKDVTPEQRETLDKLLERLEEDEDVQNVFHNMREEDDDTEE